MGGRLSYTFGNNMNPLRLIMFIGGALLLGISVYCAYSLRCFYLSPQIEQLGDPPVAGVALEVVEDWRRNTGDIVCPDMDLNSLWYALTHPSNPHDARCRVLHGYEQEVGLIYSASDGPRIAYFYKDGKGWRYAESVCLTDETLDYYLHHHNK